MTKKDFEVLVFDYFKRLADFEIIEADYFIDMTDMKRSIFEYLGLSRHSRPIFSKSNDQEDDL